MPQGTALYVRRLSKKRHGTPKQFAKLCADHGLGWIAIGGIWQQPSKNDKRKITSGRMNKVDIWTAYAAELEARGIPVWVWGYPWMGEEGRFVDMMADYPTNLVLLDPELGSNPRRASKGRGKVDANLHAAHLIELLDAHDDLNAVGLSTFGNGWRMGWFPLLAFTKALIEHYGGYTFIGGQTYTDNNVIDRSMADMAKTIDRAGGSLQTKFCGASNGVEIVPNFGTYTWVSPAGKRGKRVRGARSVRKTPAELRAHLYEFINDEEPIDAVIGWAENFMKPPQWNVLAEFGDLMKRGATNLAI